MPTPQGPARIEPAKTVPIVPAPAAKLPSTPVDPKIEIRNPPSFPVPVPGAVVIKTPDPAIEQKKSELRIKIYQLEKEINAEENLLTEAAIVGLKVTANGSEGLGKKLQNEAEEEINQGNIGKGLVRGIFGAFIEGASSSAKDGIKEGEQVRRRRIEENKNKLQSLKNDLYLLEHP